MAIRQFSKYLPQIHESAYVDESAQVIGRVCIGEDSSVWPMAVIRGDIHDIRIGKRSNIQDGSVLHVTHDSRFQPGGCALDIGSDVTVGHGVILHGCTIGGSSLIGMGSTVMDEAVIESNVMLAAGSLVSPGKLLKSGYLYIGQPAVRARELTSEETEYLLYASRHYVKLKNQYKSGDNSDS